MTGQQVLWVMLGCVVSVALDWAFYERISTSLEVFRPRRVNPPYSRLSIARKLGVAVVGGVVAASALTNRAVLLWASLVLWFVLHALICFESGAGSQHQSDAE